MAYSISGFITWGSRGWESSQGVAPGIDGGVDVAIIAVKILHKQCGGFKIQKEGEICYIIFSQWELL